MKKAFYISVLLLLTNGGSSLFAQKKELSLKEALAMARQGNKTLQLQLLEEKHAAELTRQTRSGLLPDISAGADYSYYFDRQNIFLPGSFAGTAKPVQELAVGGRNVFNGFVALYQPLLDLSVIRLTRASKINEAIQREKTEELESRVALRVSNRYLDILLMRHQLELLRQSLQRNVKALQDSRALLAQGRGLKSDTLRGMIAVENLKSSVSYLQNNMEVAGLELKRLIGMEETGELELSDRLDFDIQTARSGFYDVEEALKIAGANRNDLHIARLSVDLQQRKLNASKAEYVPRFSLLGRYNIQAQADDIRFDAWPRTSFLGVQLSIPIFNGGRSLSGVNRDKIGLQQEQLRLSDLEDEVRTALAGLLSKWKEASSRLDIRAATVQSAELNYRMTEDRFKNGLGSRLELTDAELALTEAQIGYLQAIYNLRVLHTGLQHALGLLEL